MSKAIATAFTDPSRSNAAFSSLRNVYREVKGKEKKVTHKQIYNYAIGNEAYTRHYPLRRRFKRLKTFGNAPMSHIQADLVDYSMFKNTNDGVTFLLTMVCCYSRFLFCVPLKNKSADSVLAAIKGVFDSVGKYPTYFISDHGLEFVNKKLSSYFKTLEIKHIMPSSELKAAMIERYNKSLKYRISKFFTFNNTRSYLKHLPDFVRGINNSPNRSIKTTAAKAFSGDVIPADDLLLTGIRPPSGKLKLKIGSSVRLALVRNVFSKGYEQSFSEELFIISGKIDSSPPTYTLKDLNNVDIQGHVYANEVIPCTITSDIFKIEKILSYETIRGVRYAKVKWFGYSDVFNSLVKASEIRKV